MYIKPRPPTFAEQWTHLWDRIVAARYLIAAVTLSVLLVLWMTHDAYGAWWETRERAVRHPVEGKVVDLAKSTKSKSAYTDATIEYRSPDGRTCRKAVRYSGWVEPLQAVVFPAPIGCDDPIIDGPRSEWVFGIPILPALFAGMAWLAHFLEGAKRHSDSRGPWGHRRP